jgi:FkbM family methyltransferase
MDIRSMQKIKTYEYLGWVVSADDQLYKKLLEQKRDITKDDQNRMQEIFDEHLQRKRVALDIGCHYGFFTKFLSEKFETVHAFDFANDIYQCFEANMLNFNCDNVVKHPYGLGEIEKDVATNDWFARHGRRGPLANHIDPNSTNKEHKIKSLDSLDIKDVDLMMIDTEGYELNVLKGAEQTIKENKPVLVLEFHNRNLTQKFGYSLDHLKQYVEGLGYRSIGYINKVDQVFVSEAKA